MSSGAPPQRFVTPEGDQLPIGDHDALVSTADGKLWLEQVTTVTAWSDSTPVRTIRRYREIIAVDGEVATVGPARDPD